MSHITFSMFFGFTAWDFAAFGIFALLWTVIGILVEHPPAHIPSTHRLMDTYRLKWMQEMALRDIRIFDSQVMNGLRQATAFFASATLLAVGGGAATLSQAERVAAITTDLAPEFVLSRASLEAKILIITIALTLAFLKFVWANRLFGYSATVMAAVPAPERAEEAEKIALKAAKLVNSAARSFTSGLRAVYFCLALLAWLLGPLALIGATLLTCAIVARREFASNSRKALLDE